MKNRNIYSLRILGVPEHLSSVYEGLQGINPETKEKELLCVDKFKLKLKEPYCILKGNFYNIECNKKEKYLDYVFSSDILITSEFIKKLSNSFKNFEFVLENKSSFNLNERFRFLNGRLIAGGHYYHG